MNLFNFLKPKNELPKNELPNKELSCKNNRSCTFLDLFLFILDGIVNFKDFYYEEYITPNVFLKIRKEQEENSNKYKLTFTQTHFYSDKEEIVKLKINQIVTGCQLIFYLEYDDNMKNVNFIEDTYQNNDFYKRKVNRVHIYNKKTNRYNKQLNYNYEKEGKYDCNSFMCLKQTFKYFVYLYDLCNDLKYPIHYRSKRFTIENDYCEAESKNITNEIRRVEEQYEYEYEHEIRKTILPLRQRTTHTTKSRWEVLGSMTDREIRFKDSPTNFMKLDKNVHLKENVPKFHNYYKS